MDRAKLVCSDNVKIKKNQPLIIVETEYWL